MIAETHGVDGAEVGTDAAVTLKGHGAGRATLFDSAGSAVVAGGICSENTASSSARVHCATVAVCITWLAFVTRSAVYAACVRRCGVHARAAIRRAGIVAAWIIVVPTSEAETGDQ